MPDAQYPIPVGSPGGTDVAVADGGTGASTAAGARANLGLGDVVIDKGPIDCSANPNYPAADRGDLYTVSVAGKIGGASGVDVIAGDWIKCKTDGTVSGTQAAVGSSWSINEAEGGSSSFSNGMAVAYSEGNVAQ